MSFHLKNLIRLYVESIIDEDNPRVLTQPFDPDDLDTYGQLKDKMADKYRSDNKKSSKNKKNEKDPKEFSSSGGGAVVGHVSNTKNLK
jgi:hypothetical protein